MPLLNLRRSVCVRDLHAARWPMSPLDAAEHAQWPVLRNSCSTVTFLHAK